MSIAKKDKLDAICRQITACRTCDFFEKISDKKIPFTPDAPFSHLPKIEGGIKYKVLSVGINPGLDLKQYQESWKRGYEIYKSGADYEKYRDYILKKHGDTPSGPGRYDYELTRYFNLINNKLNIYDVKDIPAEKIYDYIFWANLSFCNSQKPHKRFFGVDFGDEDIIPCRVFSEEIPICLEHAYLRDMVHDVLIEDLELVLFFTLLATGYYYPKLLIKKVLGVEYADIKIVEHSVVAHSRNGKDISVSVVAGKASVKNKCINILMLPHPGYHFEAQHKYKAIDEICGILQNPQRFKRIKAMPT